jgi:hypothetical protein
MKVNYDTLNNLYGQIGRLRKKAINKVAHLLKELGGEVCIDSKLSVELQEYYLNPEICCYGVNDDYSACSASIYSLTCDKKEKVKINFWESSDTFGIKCCPYDDILYIIEILLYIKENTNKINNINN